jgi:peptidoglycan hydrolase-like protein with peptidoglycan-binding domain
MSTMPTPPDLGDDYTAGQTPNIPSMIPMNQVPGDAVKQLQQYLANQGYPPGPVDGVYGPRTAAALHAFQQANGIPVSDTYTVQLAGFVLNDTAGVQGSGGAPAPMPQDQLTAGALPGTTVTGSDIDVIKEMYPEFSYYVTHPEIGPILADSVAKNLTPTQLWSRLTGTNWWRERSATARQWESVSMVDPATADRQRGTRRLEVSSTASRLGIQLSTEHLNWIVEHSLMWGWNDNEIMAILGQVGRSQPNAGKVGDLGASVLKLRRLAAEYLIPVGDADLREWAFRIEEGTQSEAGFSTWVQGQARARFSWMAEDIDKGVTPGQYFSPLKFTVAQTLEMNEADVDLSDPRFADLVDYVDSNGIKRGMTLAEARQWARQQPEWAKTDNARDASNSMMTGLAQLFGRM